MIRKHRHISFDQCFIPATEKQTRTIVCIDFREKSGRSSLCGGDSSKWCAGDTSPGCRSFKSSKKMSAQRYRVERALGLIEKELVVGVSGAGKGDRSEKESSTKMYPGASLWTYEDFGSTCWVI